MKILHSDSLLKKQLRHAIKRRQDSAGPSNKKFKIETAPKSVSSNQRKKSNVPVYDDYFAVESNLPKRKHSKMKVVKEVNVFNLNNLKDVRIKPLEVFESKTGIFDCVMKKGVGGSMCIQADNYLFVLGLMKNSVR